MRCAHTHIYIGKVFVFLGYQLELPTRKSSKSKTDSRVILFYTEVNNCKMSKTGNKLVGCTQTRLWKKVTIYLQDSYFSLFILAEADKESETSRGLSDEEKKEQPSEIMNALEKGFSALANIVTDEVDK